MGRSTDRLNGPRLMDGLGLIASISTHHTQERKEHEKRLKQLYDQEPGEQTQIRDG